MLRAIASLALALLLPVFSLAQSAEKPVFDVADVHVLPEKISFEQGAALGVPYATAFRGLFHRGRAVAGETVLVHGATGGVGIAAVQFARAYGLRVLATGGSQSRARIRHCAPSFSFMSMCWRSCPKII